MSDLSEKVDNILADIGCLAMKMNSRGHVVFSQNAWRHLRKKLKELISGYDTTKELNNGMEGDVAGRLGFTGPRDC